MADESLFSAPMASPSGSADVNPSESPALLAETVWVLGDSKVVDSQLATPTVEVHQSLEADHFLAATISTDVPPNLDHALDQLTTAIDLFDVPILDYHTPSSDI
jgi:hypothetical protein